MSKRLLPDAGIGVIRREEYASFLGSLKHVFLAGNLQRPCPHPYWQLGELELVLCEYGAADGGEFHWHPTVTELEIVLEGRIGYLDAASGKELSFEAGDLRVVPAGTCVRRLVTAAARTLAIKFPSDAARVTCPGCRRQCLSRVAAFVGE